MAFHFIYSQVYNLLLIISPYHIYVFFLNEHCPFRSVPVVGECHSKSDLSTLYGVAVAFRWNTLQFIVLGIALLEPCITSHTGV